MLEVVAALARVADERAAQREGVREPVRRREIRDAAAQRRPDEVPDGHRPGPVLERRRPDGVHRRHGRDRSWRRAARDLLALGREIRLPSSVIYGHVSEGRAEPKDVCDTVLELQDHMHKAHAIARKHLASAAERSKELYDARLAVNRYAAADLVWVLRESSKVGICPKLEKAYDGSFVIVERLSEVNFTVQFAKKEQNDSRFTTIN